MAIYDFRQGLKICLKVATVDVHGLLCKIYTEHSGSGFCEFGIAVQYEQHNNNSFIDINTQ